ncbi:unnamed protein product [Hydatigera taeniaeformis]|uniref:UBIQUITIN_CONJUGAT_2 domain-containing protein n=1 Tax=Hydatigena taeniaeformis TaxID=6205 RepID=A0A0R3X0C4_HYDTA|nr:unnamed protein product [Hydatigera taeniaeformis]
MPAYFQITCSPEYPEKVPDVSLDTPIFHPNIDPSNGSIHLSLLSNWQHSYNLVDLVTALLDLIVHPNFNFPIKSFEMPDNPAQLATITARALAGLPIGENFHFPPNFAWCVWARANGCLPTQGEEEEEEKEKEEEEEEEAEEEDNQELEQEGEKEVVANGSADGYDDGDDDDDDDSGTGNMANSNKMNGEETDDYTDSAGSEEEESVMEVIDASTGTMSDSVPSFAKIRYSFDTEEETVDQSQYEEYKYKYGTECHRVIIWHPTGGNETDTHTVFYFIEILGGEHHQAELGENYRSLFMGSVLREWQTHPESRQTSSACPWCGFFWMSGSSYYPRTSCSSSLNLAKLFAPNQPVTKTTDNERNAMVVKASPHEESFTCFLDDEDGSESGGIGRLFDYPNSDDGKASQNQSKPPSPSVSSQTYEEVFVARSQVMNCFECRETYYQAKNYINTDLTPQWNWMFRQTRWPIRLAPQQTVALSTKGIHIPPWRISSGQMIADICRFCTRNQNTENLVLLDPMALSPLSPLLNLVRHRRLPNPHLTGILWMTPINALSPFYQVPIPIREEQEELEEDENGKEDHVYPSPICLRFLAITAFLTNWVAWLSRMENYAALGMSRVYPNVISAPVAAHLLQPHSLGCGQAPLVDLWPMWLLRQLLTLSLQLPQLRLPFYQQNHHRLRHLFPFSNLDEI